eukprot:COSAG01_NODE_6588_length_3591_cov_1.386598_2_plen_100_part_00
MHLEKIAIVCMYFTKGWEVEAVVVPRHACRSTHSQAPRRSPRTLYALHVHPFLNFTHPNSIGCVTSRELQGSASEGASLDTAEARRGADPARGWRPSNH